MKNRKFLLLHRHKNNKFKKSNILGQKMSANFQPITTVQKSKTRFQTGNVACQRTPFGEGL